MSTLNDPSYYRRRADEAHNRAMQAATPAIRSIHLEMAARYAELLRQAERDGERPRRRMTLRAL